jgi:hypothetical protein
LDPPAIAQFLGPGNWLISKVRVSSLDRTRDVLDTFADIERDEMYAPTGRPFPSRHAVQWSFLGPRFCGQKRDRAKAGQTDRNRYKFAPTIVSDAVNVPSGHPLFVRNRPRKCEG